MLQAACEQHSGSSQSVKPSGQGKWKFTAEHESFVVAQLTLIIVLAIFAVFFEWKRAIDAIPAVVTATLEESFAAYATLAVT